MSKEDAPVVGKNLTEYRKRRDLTLRQLAAEMEKRGQPISIDGLNRIENGKRRMNTDELLALALVLNISPVSLLLPPEDPGEPVAITPKVSMPWDTAWRWAHGESTADGQVAGRAAFIAANRPYEKHFRREVQRFLAFRVTERPYLLAAYKPPHGAWFMYGYTDEAAIQVNDELQRGQVERRRAAESGSDGADMD